MMKCADTLCVLGHGVSKAESRAVYRETSVTYISSMFARNTIFGSGRDASNNFVEPIIVTIQKDNIRLIHAVIRWLKKRSGMRSR